MWIVNTLDDILLVKLGRVRRAGREGRKQTLAGGGFGRIVHNKDECTATTMSFIPTEILANIFDFLDFRQLLACRAVRHIHTHHTHFLILQQVCSLFKFLIDSPSLQYKIELAITGQEDGFHHSLYTRRTLLKSHQNSWDALQWTQDQRLGMFHGGLWELYGNVLAQNSSSQQTLHLKQLPSQSRAIEEKNWTVDVSQYRIRDFSIDPAHDLLIIVEQPQEFVISPTGVNQL